MAENVASKKQSVEFQLTKCYLAVRLTVIVGLIPLLRSIWNRVEYQPESDSVFRRMLDYLQVFDAVHFQHVTESGYEYELNHAFFPGMPWALHHLSQLTQYDTQVVNLAVQLVLGWLNTLLIYKVGTKIFDKERISEVASYMYIISHSMVYQISMYTENLFLFFSLMGLYFIYRCKKQEANWLPNSSNIILGTFCFGLATLVRSTGILMSIFVAYFYISKMIEQSNKFCSLFKYILFSCLCAVIVLLPLWVVVIWKPYMIHCEPKLDRADAVPEWCLDSFPNVYSHIQRVYWDVKPFGFLYRPTNHIFTALPMNFVFFYICYRVISEQPRGFLTFGLGGDKIPEGIKKASIFSQKEILPHAYYMMFQLGLVIYAANIDINSRVASTIPFYYWAVASIIVEGDGTISQRKQPDDTNPGTFLTLPARIAVFHNLLYMCLNIVLFPLEIAFF